MTVKPPTPEQLSYIARLSSSRGMRFARPASRAAASKQINALKAIPVGRVERAAEGDLVADVAVAQQYAEVREFELDGYGSSCRWARSVSER